ncbi:hypothetical protein [Amycolatopsis sp. PS_44_ISF1]|uniref:hypothetical protein n=1 Tax=Amycolatopsis sp. PS_44_ISF1 TaxID=2974917 RepID=UPI0028DEB89B|nr:hypothetical protein [Amycolatopsis sp. PS_44_ISF1]MDT8913720.1 hypothetical protein [Amycolatopsis sp. PS_44_ISF1]
MTPSLQGEGLASELLVCALGHSDEEGHATSPEASNTRSRRLAKYFRLHGRGPLLPGGQVM